MEYFFFSQKTAKWPPPAILRRRIGSELSLKITENNGNSMAIFHNYEKISVKLNFQNWNFTFSWMSSLFLLVVFQSKVKPCGMSCEGETLDGNESDCDLRKITFQSTFKNPSPNN